MPAGRPPAVATASSTSGTVASGRLSVSVSVACDALEVAVVPAHGGGGDRARAGRCASRRCRRTTVFWSRLRTPSVISRRAHLGHRDQRAHLDHVREPLAQRLREVVVEQPRLGLGLRGGAACRRWRDRSGSASRRGGAASARRRAAVRRTCRRTCVVPARTRPRRTSRCSLSAARALSRSAPSGNRRNCMRRAQSAMPCNVASHGESSTPDLLIDRPRRPTSRGQRGSVSPRMQ